MPLHIPFSIPAAIPVIQGSTVLKDTIEVQTVAKMTWRILPFIMLLYCTAYLDRVNIGFAALQMNGDIGLSPATYGFGAGIFFLGYFLFELPSNIILHRVGARIWIARIMITWGSISALTAFVQTANMFYALRFLLGVAEAGFFPGLILYLSYWYPERYRATIIALFMSAIPIATALGSPLSTALLGLHAWGLHGWQWMFLVEAAPAILLGFGVMMFLTDRPEQAAWLHDHERQWLIQTLHEEQLLQAPQARRGLLQGMTDPRILAISFVYFGSCASLYTLGLWAPQMIKSFGVSDMQVGWLNGCTALIAIVPMLLWARHSDQQGERYRHCILATVVSAFGLLLAGPSSALPIAVIALLCINIGTSAAKPPIWSMPTSFLSGSAAAAGIATVNSLGNLGGFIGPAMIGWIKEKTGSFAGGLYFVAGLVLVSAGVTWLLAQQQKNHAPIEDALGTI